FTPAACEVRVGNGGAANHNTVREAIGHQGNSFLASSDFAETGVHQERAIEALAKILDQGALRVVVQDAEVRQVKRRNGLHQHFIGGADVRGIRLGDALHIVFRGDPDAHAV